jgi:hypothetical protein
VPVRAAGAAFLLLLSVAEILDRRFPKIGEIRVFVENCAGWEGWLLS